MHLRWACFCLSVCLATTSTWTLLLKLDRGGAPIAGGTTHELKNGRAYSAIQGALLLRLLLLRGGEGRTPKNCAPRNIS